MLPESQPRGSARYWKRKALKKGRSLVVTQKISTKTCRRHRRDQSLADRRATMRSRLGPGSPSSWSRGTIEASAASLLTRLVRPRTLVFLSLFVIVGYIFTVSRHDNSGTIDNTINQLDEIVETKPSIPDKVILFWTPYYNDSDYTVGFGRDPFVKNGCKFTNCITTADRNLLDKSDAVIFHAFQVNSRDLPAHRHPRQRFVFFLYETIPNTSIPCIGKCLPERQYLPHYFNWTMTHRRDSDVYVAEQYGAITPKLSAFPAQLPDELPPGTLPANPAELLNRNYPQVANKTKMVAWFASHCPTHSQREDYVKELSKFVQVDIYGKCGTMECLPRNSYRCENLLDNYKFYLAAENSLCPDYVSEKFYRALSQNIVPIVYGGAEYAEYAPPHSFINIADFKSPQDLAAYLKLLDSHDALYLEYFRWKKHYEVVRKPKKGWCDLCAKLNDPQLEAATKSYADVGHWWIRKLPCYPGSSFLMSHT